ncbi:SDR family NAD(P)-dependent oxidoreductase [Paenibacillus endoradicis]|uniref:SDR family NAD(P)-dependent oxidoreductase n=1 Tax=Paenibacillus endoradicis TaxID=2972487 RepID=UPI0021597259|nr:SDR family NAD(P)-dependent oxidoreductase [Paenibacillus endoradicis]MCR8657663.1 SDR family NAD(P)-dependent oxidoreductase [Paenibacillus endoradicis]
MKKVLVAGATGGIGYALVQQLTKQNIEVVAFARGADKLRTMFGHNKSVTCVSGDVLNVQNLLDACEDIDTIIHAVSFPYQKWNETHIPCLVNMLEAAKRSQSKFILVDNIYAYGKQPQAVDEVVMKFPHTKKGKLRLKMESLVKESGIPYLIAHVPDVFGPNAKNTILHGTLQAAVQNKAAYFVGRMDVTREFAYTNDVAEIIYALALNPASFNQHWNIPGCLKISGQELSLLLQQLLGYRPKIRVATSKHVAFLALFSSFMREQKEMMYLTETPVILNATKLEKALGTIPFTDRTQSLRETIEWIKKST